MENNNIQELIELHNDLENVICRLESAMDNFRSLQSDIHDLQNESTEKIFEPYIAAGFIPGAYISVVGQEHRAYKIVAIRDCQYAVVDLNQPENKINMPLFRYNTCWIDRYILLDEKTAKAKASKCKIWDNGIVEMVANKSDRSEVSDLSDPTESEVKDEQ